MNQGEGFAERVQREYGELTYRIIGAAMRVHNALGPGFPEYLYQRALAVELVRRGIKCEREKPIQVFYGDAELGIFYLDFMVEDRVIVELKAVDQLTANHEQQVISYLTASGREVALLINFGAASLAYKRILPPLAVQHSAAYQSRRDDWKAMSSNQSAQSA